MKEGSNANNDRMSWGHLLGFSIGGLGMNVCFAMVSGYALYFFTDMLGISAAVAGSILMVSRIFDGVSDIGMGTLVDKTNSRHGKARPWLFWLAIPMGLSMIPLFSVPDLPVAGKVVWAFLTYNLVTTVLYTAVNVPYMSFTSLLTEDPVERSRMSIVKMTFAMFSSMIINASTIQVVDFFGGGERGWQLTAIVYGIIIVIVFYIVYFSTTEKVQPKEVGKKVTQKGELMALCKNKYWLLIIAITILLYVSMATSGATVYFCQYYLKDMSKIPVLIYAGMLPTVLTIMCLTPFVKRFGKRNITMAGMCLVVIGYGVMLTAPENISVVVSGMILKGIGLAGASAFLQPMIADSATYGRWKFGKKSEGKAFGGLSFGMKVGSGVGAAMIGWILALGGYVAAQPDQSPSALTAIKVIFMIIPLVNSILMIALLYFYDLDKIYPQVLSELKEREGVNQ